MHNLIYLLYKIEIRLSLPRFAFIPKLASKSTSIFTAFYYETLKKNQEQAYPFASFNIITGSGTHLLKKLSHFFSSIFQL